MIWGSLSWRSVSVTAHVAALESLPPKSMSAAGDSKLSLFAILPKSRQRVEAAGGQVVQLVGDIPL